MNHPAEDPEPVHEWHEVNWLPKNLPFSENPGPLSDAAVLDSIEPKDFVELFISDLLIQNIVDQTNLYADQCIQAMDGTSQHARIHAWKPGGGWQLFKKTLAGKELTSVYLFYHFSWPTITIKRD